MSLDEELVQEGEASDAQSEVGTGGSPGSTPFSKCSSYSIHSDADSSCNSFVSGGGLRVARVAALEAGDCQHIDLHAERATSLEMIRGQSDLQVDVEHLLSENLRLQMENSQLREGLAVSASSGAIVARPSCGQLPPAQLNAEAGRTTVMLRNLPNNYTRDMVFTMLDEEGFAGLYDFLYLPIDFKSHACLGYAFINLVDTAAAAKFWRAFDGYRSWVLPSRKVCQIGWSGPHQGLQAHIERYRNSPIMHESVPDECKPMIFRDGVRTAFPGPTKSTKAPRLRMQRHQGPEAQNGQTSHHRRFNLH